MSYYEQYAELIERTARRITNSLADWTAFLAFAGRLYKYPFDQQLMIYAQRPNAVACAPETLWTKRMKRRIREGCLSVPVVDNTGTTPVLRYVFDLSDTEADVGSRVPWLWKYREEYYGAVSEALEKRFGPVIGDDMETKLEEISKRLALECWNDRREDILDAVSGSFLEEFDALNVEISFRNAASVSMAYSMMSRCGLEPEKYFRHDDFLSVFNFNTPAVMSPLGNAVNESAEQALREIEKAVKSYERARALSGGHRF
ncbi:MAG: hypothetical protein IJQ81_08390 [Oscillibacter sp.]|nr:hypothetical protein [Oscillibacter sp.]